MLFKDLLQIITEAKTVGKTAKTSDSIRKDRAKSSAPDTKARDAARKRAERAREIPRDKKSKGELLKEILLVKTRSGRVQLIFKDSFNKQQHELLNKSEISIEEARQATKDPKFEQTRASQLLFGNVKEKEKGGPKKQKESGRPAQKAEEKKKEEPKSDETVGEKKSPKGRRLSQEEIFQAMTQMDGQQLAQMPFEMRQQFFKMMRKPPANADFDHMSYEGLSVKFNLSPISNLPYNQQVLNAIMFLAKIKAGAGEQEMQTYGATVPEAIEFTRPAFLTAKKILSQIGDECIQNLISSVELGTKAVNAEGAVDMECGAYKFKVSAGGEMSLSTSQFDQTNKSFRGLVASALVQALSNPQILESDEKIKQVMQENGEKAFQFATTLIPDEALASIMADEKLLRELQSLKLKNGLGEDIGPIIDENGKLNPLASLNNYRSIWTDASKSLLKGSKSAQKSPFRAAIANMLLKINLRGDNVVDPKMAPNHLITVNGVFPLSDDYFNEISRTAEIDVKPAKNILSSSNISNYKPSSAEMLKKFSTIIEEKESTSLKDILVPTDKIDPITFIAQQLSQNNDFMMNVSLLPGFTPKDINSVEYTYLNIGKKTIKIPIENGERIANQGLAESLIIVNDALLEALTNDFVLASLLSSNLIDVEEAIIIQEQPNLLTEDSDGILKGIYRNIWQRLYENPDLIFEFMCQVDEEYKRDYKKEYKNYHGKPKQRKERAARTAARELMIKKGRVKKGDGKDIDHKRALRNGGSKGINNLRVRDKSANRSDNGHKKGEKQNKGSWK
jgi:hypothetical protein